MTPNCNMQTLTSNRLIFKVLLLQQTRDKIITRTQKSMLKIQAKKKSLRHLKANRRSSDPALCAALRLLLAPASPQLLGDPHWELTHMSSAEKMARSSPSSFPHGSTNTCASRRKGEEAGTNRAAEARWLDCFSRQYSLK